MRGRATIVLAVSFVLVAGLPRAAADLVQFRLENNAAVSYPMSSGALINYELYVEIIDDDADGPDSQGLASYHGDLLTNTGAAPTIAHSYTSTAGVYGVLDPLWTSAMDSVQRGGFGMGFLSSLGTVSGDDIISAGAFMDTVWDADVGGQAGNQPAALAGIGFGTPGTAVDSGGNPFSPSLGAPREKWYLLAGTVAVPDAPGVYTVEWDDEGASLIRIAADLSSDVTTGYIETATVTGSRAGDSFSFTVVPEPATLSALLVAGAALTTRRRR